jgi:hypothetical protein
MDVIPTHGDHSIVCVAVSCAPWLPDLVWSALYPNQSVWPTQRSACRYTCTVSVHWVLEVWSGVRGDQQGPRRGWATAGGQPGQPWWYSSATAHRSMLHLRHTNATQAIHRTGGQGCIVSCTGLVGHLPTSRHALGGAWWGGGDIQCCICWAHQLVIRHMTAPPPTPCC